MVAQECDPNCHVIKNDPVNWFQMEECLVSFHACQMIDGDFDFKCKVWFDM